MWIARAVCAILVGIALGGLARADSDLGYRVLMKAGTYENVRDDLKDAIVNRGFVIDYVGQFNAMLERTADAADSVTRSGDKSPFKNAEYMQFCPSKLTHEAVSASPLSIANCPVAIFVFELRHEPGKIQVGYRLPVASPSKRVREVNEKLAELLHSIASEATK